MSTTAPAMPAGFKLWLAGARTKTWPAGIVPVLVGSAAAAHANSFSWWRASLALVVGLSMQIGVNYANDYSDGIRGTDARRVGPLRITASGLAKPRTVKLAAFACFGIGAVAGLILALSSAPWLIAVGALAILAAWYYTGGSRPYGYSGLGEVSVFIFFGLVATVGTTYTQVGAVTLPALIGSFAMGALAVALLLANNLRDIPTDAATGKKTLAVRMGDTATRGLFTVCLIVPFVLLVPLAFATAWTLLAFAAILIARAPITKVMNGASGASLVPVLQATGKTQLAYGVLLSLGLII